MSKTKKKRMLSLRNLVRFMEEDKGIRFERLPKSDAIEYMSKHTYYTKLNAYRLNFEKWESGPNAGKYKNLDYACLKALSTIDALLRRVLLPMTLDIEQGIKLHLMNDIMDNPAEDGFRIVERFLQQEKHAKAFFRRSNQYCYCRDHVARHQEHMPIWVLFEVLPLGELVKLYNLYYATYPQRSRILHPGLLEHVVSLRNAVAHDNCLLYDLNRLGGTAVELQSYLRRNKMLTPAMQEQITKRFPQDFIAFIIVYRSFVQEPYFLRRARRDLYKLFYRDMRRDETVFQEHDAILDMYYFFRNFLDDYFFGHRK